MDVGIKTANDQFQTVTTAQRTALVPTVGQCVWDSDLRQLMVFMNATGGNAWQPIGNRIVCTSTTRPATPFHGQVIYETDTKREWVYDGTRWVQTNSASTTSGVTSVSNLIVPPMVRIARTTGQTVANTTWVYVDTWTQTFGTDGMWTASNNYIEIQTAGIYLVQYGGAWANNTTNDRLANISLNDTVPGNSSIHTANVKAIGVSDTSIFGSFIYSFAVNDRIRFQVYQNSGGNLAFGTTANGFPYMSAIWIGRTS